MSELLPSRELHRKRQILLSRLRRKYDITETEYLIGPLRIPFARVTNADTVLDQVCNEIDEIEKRTGEKVPDQLMHMPYWAELWDSSYGVGHWLVDRARLMKSDLHTLDLGCGMGFAGTVAAMLGHRVFFADLEVPALLFAKLNSLPWLRRVRCRQLNWQTDQLNESFDLIIGADVLYEKSQWEFLEPFFRNHLAKDGVVLLGEPGRGTGDLFGDWIRAKGWNLTLTEQKVFSRDCAIRLFELRLGK
jgi:predicted nicotinamide N-methyase